MIFPSMDIIQYTANQLTHSFDRHMNMFVLLTVPNDSEVVQGLATSAEVFRLGPIHILHYHRVARYC